MSADGVSSTPCNVFRGGTDPRATGAPEELVLMLTAHQGRDPASNLRRNPVSTASVRQHDDVLCGRGIELDLELDAPARRHHDRAPCSFARSVAPFCRRTARHRGPQPRSECSEPRRTRRCPQVAGGCTCPPAALTRRQSSSRWTRKADLGQGGRPGFRPSADRDPVDAQIGFAAPARRVPSTEFPRLC